MNEKTKNRTRRILLAAGIAVALAGGLYYFLFSGRYVETENAYVKADRVMLAPEVSGRVTQMNVGDNEAIKQGQLLFTIDKQPYQIALQQAQAQLDSVGNQLAAEREAYYEARSKLDAAKEDVQYLEREVARKKDLLENHVATQSQYDQLNHQLQKAHAMVDGTRREIDRIQAALGGNPDLPVEQQASYQQATAALDKAKLDLEHTDIHAPLSGVAADVNLQEGEMVSAGRPVFGLVRGGHHWVEANLKETDLGNVAVGDKAEIRIDAYPGKVWTAHVSSISPATGAEFSLLPPQNATGNWVKVVQRVPVRLELDDADNLPPLRAGLSAQVEIDTHSHSENKALAGR